MSRITLITFISLLLGLSNAFAQIRHLELGAANIGGKNRTHQTRFHAIETLLPKLIINYGEEGTIFLSDINHDGLLMAQRFAINWLVENDYPNIKVETILGNYDTTPLPRVTTARLSHPGNKQFVASSLIRLADHSETGLEVITYFNKRMRRLVEKSARIIDTGKPGELYYTGDGSTLRDIGEGPPRIYHVQGRSHCGTFMSDVLKILRLKSLF